MFRRRVQPDEKPQPVIFCAGLSFVGSRDLIDADRNQLKRGRRRLILACIIWLVFVPFGFPILLGVCLRLVIGNTDALGAVITLLGIVGLFVGLPVGLLKARDLARRSRMLKRTAVIGAVRCFEGQFNDDDWTDLTRETLKQTGLAHLDGLNRLELLADSEVIYRLNNLEPRKWTTVAVTTAAAAPVSPARFAMPSYWESLEDGIEVTRRRLTDEERSELNGYARSMRKGRWMYAIPVFFFARLIAVFGSKLASVQVRTGVAITVGVAAFVYLFIRSTREASRWKHDAEYGWLAVIDPAGHREANSAHSETPPPMEILPLSRAAWTIRSKPAGWRRHHRYAGKPCEPSNQLTPP